MGWKKNYQRLYCRVYKKLNYNSESAFDKYLQRKSNKLGLASSEASLVVLAMENNIGHRTELRMLNEPVQNRITQIIQGRNIIQSPGNNVSKNVTPISLVNHNSSRFVDLTEIIKDPELKDRCVDLLKRPRNHDRVFREATTILDQRIKTLSGITQKLNPQNLIGKAISPDPTKSVLVISSDPAEQEGFYKICSGVGLLFRNRTHHEISNKLGRDEAFKFCGFIDSILLILNDADIHRERI